MELKSFKNNMYDWVTKKRNYIGGECPHQCSYCYVNAFKKYPKTKERYTGNPFLIEKELEKNEGSGNIIFVQDCGDMFANIIASEWISKILEHCREFDNTYLFQTKNPKRFFEFLSDFPKKTILGTTIETNRESPSKAPETRARAYYMWLLSNGYEKMVSIEPIMDFDLENLIQWIKLIKPNFVSIGADSKKHNLPEPSKDKIEKLIEELNKITKVKIKSNLKRLL